MYWKERCAKNAVNNCSGNQNSFMTLQNGICKYTGYGNSVGPFIQYLVNIQLPTVYQALY